jgi:hypothetical protein
METRWRRKETRWRRKETRWRRKETRWRRKETCTIALSVCKRREHPVSVHGHPKLGERTAVGLLARDVVQRDRGSLRDVGDKF